MRSVICTVPLLALITVAGTLGAQEKFDPAARAAAIAPFIDEQTFAVFHVEPVRIDVDQIADLMLDLMPELNGHPEETVNLFKQLRTAFLEAGLTDLYIVASQADWEGPFCVIPNPHGHDVKELIAAWLRITEGKGDFNDVGRFKGAIVVGNPEKLQRLTKAFRPDTRAELAEAFRAAGDTAMQFILYPSADQRRVLEETMPELPSAVGGGPMTILTRGMLWAAIGFDAPPHASLRVVVRSEDARAAEALRKKLVEATRRIVQPDGLPGWLAERLTPSQAEQAVGLLTPQVAGDRLVLTLGEQEGRIQALLDAVKPPSEKARRLQTHGERKQSYIHLLRIGIAMHLWHSVHGSFPAPANYDADGKPLLSWRVHVLPHLHEEKLYEEFHLDEPWDSEHNRKLLQRMPAVYRSPASKLEEKGRTSYLLPVGKGTVFPGREALSMQDIKDGTSSTILAVEVAGEHAVIWTKPEDWPVDLSQPAKGLIGAYEDGLFALTCNGSVHFLELPQAADMLRALFTPNGGEKVPDFWRRGR